MTENCRKTCNKCKCNCCSYKGKKHGLGARIPMPDKCGELLCQEGLMAEDSPLLPGASHHNVSHPEELTLVFKSMFPGSHCCILPADAEEEDGNIARNQSMVQEGWTGKIAKDGVTLEATCCHGVLSVPLQDSAFVKLPSSTITTLPPPPPTTTVKTTTTETTTMMTETTTAECSSDFSSAKASSQISGGRHGPEYAIDGKISKDNEEFFHSIGEEYPWLQLEMCEEQYVRAITIVSRHDCCAQRLKNIEVRAGLDSVPDGFKGRLRLNYKMATYAGPATEGQSYTINFSNQVRAKYITLQGERISLEINEVMIGSKG